MRQYDRSSPVREGVGGRQKGIETGIFWGGHGQRFAFGFPRESRARIGNRRRNRRKGRLRGSLVTVMHQCFENAAASMTQTLLFVRRNDILLQCGMALQAVPLPSLGVSSLDLGRSFNRAALFLSASGSYSAAARGIASHMTPPMSARTMASRSHLIRSKPGDLAKLVSSI